MRHRDQGDDNTSSVARCGSSSKWSVALLKTRDAMQYLTDSTSACGVRPNGLCNMAASRVLQGEAGIGALVVRFSWGRSGAWVFDQSCAVFGG